MLWFGTLEHATRDWEDVAAVCDLAAGGAAEALSSDLIQEQRDIDGVGGELRTASRAGAVLDSLGGGEARLVHWLLHVRPAQSGQGVRLTRHRSFRYIDPPIELTTETGSPEGA
jgi:hypothetical protein